MMMDKDFPISMSEKGGSSTKSFPEFLKQYLPKVPGTQKPHGYVREELEGERSYSQAGTDIPDFGVQQAYEQKEGGPVFEQMVAGGIPVGEDPIFPMSQDEFKDLIYRNLDQGKPTPPLPSRMQERMQNFKKRYSHLFV